MHRLSVSCGKLLRLICTNLKFRGLRLMEIMTKFRITVQEPGVCVFVCRCVRSCIGQSARSSGAPCMSDLSPASCRRVTLGWHWPHTGKTLLPAHPQTGHIYLAFIALHALLHTLSSTDTHTHTERKIWIFYFFLQTGLGIKTLFLWSPTSWQ